jgi:hypothetical protein
VDLFYYYGHVRRIRVPTLASRMFIAEKVAMAQYQLAVAQLGLGEVERVSVGEPDFARVLGGVVSFLEVDRAPR